ncbi:ATP-binding protein [Aestuariivivens sediminicola]|uniref:ATP-binding protein n=1 Tax=Aestuariivivens sediminicola TaxID=2913560 RepID=UPI001F58D39D|nr:ATP-binding protein [Aestuariivivens sediminicola]
MTQYVYQSDDTSDNIILKITWLLLNIGGLLFLLPFTFIYGFTSGPVVFVMNIIFCLGLMIPLMIFHFHRRNIESFAFATQLILVVMTSIKVYLMGGLLNVGTPVYVGLMAPIYALTLPNKKRAVFIFIFFIVSLIIATLLNPHGPDDHLFAHYFVGLLIFSSFTFFTLYYYTTQLQRIKAQEKKRVKDLDELRTKFYTHITHEFRTPVNIIAGMVDQMKKNPSKWLNEGHSIVKRNSRNLISLTDKLLDLSKLKAGSMPLNFIQDDIVLYIEYLVESFHSLAAVKHIKLSFSAEPKTIRMDFDPDKIHDIIYNLISNAIKFTPDRGSVKIGLTRIEDYSFVLKVKDTGIGIPKDQLHRIFDPYFQAKNHLETLKEGSGLGLSLTREIVKLLDGTIQVNSIYNKGSLFTVTLPITNRAPIAQLPLPPKASHDGSVMLHTPAVERQDTNQLTLLIVEDNTDVIRYLQSLLAPYYHLEVAGNGFEGLNRSLEIIPDLIISDVMMPVMDGFTMCKKLKENIRTSHIPIVLLTARVDSDSRNEGLKCGADAYLNKPFNQEELFIRINKLIALRHQLQLRYRSVHQEQLSSDTMVRSDRCKEDQFIHEVHTILKAHLADEEFGIKALCRSLGMSRAQLYRKFSALTNTTVYCYLRTLRLKKARELLLTTNRNVTEVAYDTGFKNLSHFSRTFAKEFGHAPSKTKI